MMLDSMCCASSSLDVGGLCGVFEEQEALISSLKDFSIRSQLFRVVKPFDRQIHRS